MIDSEKVVKGLECCTFPAEALCEVCPYHDDCMKTDGGQMVMADALEVLKAQEPRVMTLEEVNALDWDYCYLEQERLQGNEYRRMLGKYIMTCVTWPSITAAKILQGMDNYGKTWRCWTSRPTPEQREATPWE